MRRALGRRRRARRRHRKPERLAHPARARRLPIVLDMYKQGWEGHLRQYTQAKTKQVPFARAGMYYKEFPVMFDWLHNGEGLTPFDLQGLADPNDAKFQSRVRRFAGFYTNEDAGRPQLRRGPQDHPQHVQRQPRSAVAQGDGRSTGPAIRSRSAIASSRCTANTTTPRCSPTSRSTTTSWATTP